MKFRKSLAGILAAAAIVSMLPVAHAESSSQIQEEINALAAQQAAIQQQMADIQAQQDENWASIEEMVAYKSSIDQEIFLLYSEIDNLNQQITSYTTLIAQTQTELDQAQADLDEVNVRYRQRIRAMEEEGDISYWEVLFKANSFTDLIDRLNMVREIAAADQRLMDEMRQVTERVAATKASLEEEKAGLEASRDAQEAAMAKLDEKRAESDKVLQELNAQGRELDDLQAEKDAENQALANQIAQEEKALNEARAREEEERRRKEEEERKKQEEADKNNNNNNNSSKPDSTEPTEDNSTDEPDKPTEPTEPEEPTTPPSADNGWRQPCSYVYISSSYGSRGSGWHNGVDFAASRGTPIYASRSGTVTKAVSLTYSYGNHVVINHGDGYSSLYAHMDYYVVSPGQYVSQGQLIGYVGSTGNSTGPHLHFTIFYNGSDVNPMNYL